MAAPTLATSVEFGRPAGPFHLLVANNQERFVCGDYRR